MPTDISNNGTIGNPGGGQVDDPLLTALTIVDPVTIAGQSQPAVTVQSHQGAFAPFFINAILGSSVTSLGDTGPDTQTLVRNAITAAVNWFDANFTSSVPLVVNNNVTNTVTVNIQFDFGKVNTTVLPAGSGGRSEYGAQIFDNYGSLLTAINKGTGGTLTLPATDPSGGAGFEVASAEEKILGINPNDSAIDGFVGVSSSSTLVGAVPVDWAVTGVGEFEHEISEVLGRAASVGVDTIGATPLWTIQDVFRFTAANTPAVTPGAADYFSIDNGTSALAFFNNAAVLGGDTGDWISSGPNAVATDPFNASGGPNDSVTISAADVKILNVLGLQTVACFVEGTRILTPSGERAVETLAEGDEVVTLLGGATGRAIWIGRRAIDLERHPKPWTVWPVLVRAGAFAPGLPARDLYLSPDHAVYAQGVLIPVKHLINGASIQQVKRRSVVYHHIELDRHDVVLAESLPAESYLDSGDRASFEGGEVMTLHPDFTARGWEMNGCAPLVLTGPDLDSVRARLAARAGRVAA